MKTKKAISTFFAFVFAASALITSLSTVALSAFSFKKNEVIEASAAVNYDSVQRLDNNFEFLNGASVKLEGEAKEGKFKTSLSFGLSITNPEWFSSCLNNDKDIITFKYQIIREGGDRADVAVYELYLMATNTYTLAGHKKLTLTEEDVGVEDLTLPANGFRFEPDQSESALFYASSEDVKNPTYMSNLSARQPGLKAMLDSGIALVSDSGYEFDFMSVARDSVPFMTETDEGQTHPFLRVAMDVNSPYSEYYVVCDYKLKDYVETLQERRIWGYTNYLLFKVPKYRYVDVDVYNEDVSGKIKSPTRSVYGTLKNIEAAGKLEQEVGTSRLALANFILGNSVEKTVTVQYLEQIGNSPFAKRAEKRVTVMTTNNTVYYDDVAKAVGGTMECLGAYPKAVLNVDTNNVCKIEYLHSVACEAQTTDAGHTEMYYLNVNKTFSEYYDGLVEDGVFEQGAAEVMFNKMKQNHPVIANYNTENLYGLWGYVVVPETHSLDSIFKDIFRTPSDFTGSIVSAVTNGKLSFSAYNQLLDVYGYSWLKRVWNHIWEALDGDIYNCTHYFFYADPKFQEITIDESGSGFGEDHGAAKETLDDAVDKVLGVVDEVKKEYNDSKASLERTLKVIAGVAMGLVAVGGVAFIVIYSKRKNGK